MIGKTLRNLDVTGKKYNKLTCLYKYGKHHDGRVMWMCACECGTHKPIPLTYVVNGKTKSCGCLRNFKHGLSDTRVYRVWRRMKDRCDDPKSSNYPYYGGNGVTYCKEWVDFKKFYDWAIKNGYQDNLTLDRIDNEKGYHPDNCRWATHKEQNNNKKNNIHLDYKGNKLTLSQLADQLKVKREKVYYLYRKGLNAKEIISKIYS